MNKNKAFTLAEVLITLVIIGVIAAITVPSIMQNTQDREFASKLKKVHSTIQNASRRAQVEEGMMGDNTALFTTETPEGANWLVPANNTAKRMAKYMNVMRVCENSTKDGCNIDPMLKYATEYFEDRDMTLYPFVVLNDGTVIFVDMRTNCYEPNIEYDILDEKGNPTGKTDTWTRRYCGELVVDVNGQKKPNRFGRDVYQFLIYKDKITLGPQRLAGNDAGKKNLYN